MPTATYQRKSVVVGGGGEKRKEVSESANDDESHPPKKRFRRKCSAEGCTNQARGGVVCKRHGAKKTTLCSFEGCTNNAIKKGGVCSNHRTDLVVALLSKASGSRSGSRGNEHQQIQHVQQQQPQYMGPTSGLSSLDHHPYLRQNNNYYHNHSSLNPVNWAWEGRHSYYDYVEGRTSGGESVAVLESVQSSRIQEGNSSSDLMTKMGIENKEDNEEGGKKQPPTREESSVVATQASSVQRGNEGSPPKKKRKNYCSVEGCKSLAQQGGVCQRHGAKVKIKLCNFEGCTNQAQNGKVCIRHGAKSKHRLCSVGGCTKLARTGRVCMRHGAKRNIKLCNFEGCTNQVRRGGVCIRHGAETKRNIKLCSSEGCTNQVWRGGVCRRHEANSLVDTPSTNSSESRGNEHLKMQRQPQTQQEVTQHQQQQLSRIQDEGNQNKSAPSIEMSDNAVAFDAQLGCVDEKEEGEVEWPKWDESDTTIQNRASEEGNLKDEREQDASDVALMQGEGGGASGDATEDSDSWSGGGDDQNECDYGGEDGSGDHPQGSPEETTANAKDVEQERERLVVELSKSLIAMSEEMVAVKSRSISEREKSCSLRSQLNEAMAQNKEILEAEAKLVAELAAEKEEKAEMGRELRNAAIVQWKEKAAKDAVAAQLEDMTKKSEAEKVALKVELKEKDEIIEYLRRKEQIPADMLRKAYEEMARMKASLEEANSCNIFLKRKEEISGKRLREAAVEMARMKASLEDSNSRNVLLTKQDKSDQRSSIYYKPHNSIHGGHLCCNFEGCSTIAAHGDLCPTHWALLAALLARRNVQRSLIQEGDSQMIDMSGNEDEGEGGRKQSSVDSQKQMTDVGKHQFENSTSNNTGCDGPKVMNDEIVENTVRNKDSRQNGVPEQSPLGRVDNLKHDNEQGKSDAVPQKMASKEGNLKDDREQDASDVALVQGEKGVAGDAREGSNSWNSGGDDQNECDYGGEDGRGVQVEDADDLALEEMTKKSEAEKDDLNSQVQASSKESNESTNQVEINAAQNEAAMRKMIDDFAERSDSTKSNEQISADMLREAYVEMARMKASLEEANSRNVLLTRQLKELQDSKSKLEQEKATSDALLRKGENEANEKPTVAERLSAELKSKEGFCQFLCFD